MGADSSLNEAVVTNRGKILEFRTVLVITDLGSGCYRSRQLKSGQLLQIGTQQLQVNVLIILNFYSLAKKTLCLNKLRFWLAFKLLVWSSTQTEQDIPCTLGQFCFSQRFLLSKSRCFDFYLIIIWFGVKVTDVHRALIMN